MKLRREPNPVWLREMRQAARLTRTPLILSTITAIAGLLVCAVGGAASTSAAPAEVGSTLFQTFFSLAFALVAWVGPGVAALTIASERAGHTWEAVVLTGFPPRGVALGKFLASLTYVGLYLAALAPVGALPFLFGGVTATEVVAAFALLGVFASLSVGFGLAVSSGAKSPAMALLVTLPLAVAASLFTYFGLGLGLSFAAHEVWPAVSQGVPVWLPGAYARADFGLSYVVYLLTVPLLAAAVLAGFFREVTVANLSDANDDRSTGLKRWFVAASGAVSAIALLSLWQVPHARWVVAIAGIGASFLLSMFALFVLAGDPPGPSRRVSTLWEREGASRLRRFLGPGLTRTAALLVAVTALTEGVVAAAGYVAERAASGSSRDLDAVLVAAAYGTIFFGFLAGFATFARTRRHSRFAPRAQVALALFAATAGPFFVVAIAGLTASADHTAWVAAASPLYVFAVIAELSSASGTHVSVVAGLVALGLWAVLGATLGIVGARRLGRMAHAEEETWRALDARVAEEDRTEPPTAGAETAEPAA